MTIRSYSLLTALILLSVFKFSRQFSEETIKFSVSEDAPINSIIGNLEAQDGFTYRLSRGNSKIKFDDQTLELSVSAHLDRESEDAIDMLVITSPPSIIHILIDILDVNDNAPKFPLDPQKVEIPETAPIGWRVSISGATDPDEAKNGTIGGYELREAVETDGTTTPPPFSIVQSDGFVFVEVSGRLDREERDLYSMRLTASDQGTPQRSASCLLNILVLDTNDNPPDFGTRSISLDWNGRSSAALFRLNATDPDSGDNSVVHYRILAPANEYFSISDGDILVTQNNTADACSPRCEFTVEAKDSGVPPLTTTLNVVVHVEYGNEHEPNINIRFYPADFPFIVVQPEDVNGKTLAILSITDSDGPLGDNATIWIESGNEDSIFSLISRQSINILTLKSVENAKKEQYTIEFGANDGQKPTEKTARKALKLFFKRYVKSTYVHVDPEFHVNVERDTVPGSFVAHVLTNCSNMCLFELLDSDVFKIDPTNGIIVTSAQLPDDVASFHLPVKIRLPPPSTNHLETDVFVKVIKESVPKTLIRTAQTTVHLKRAYTFSTWHNVSIGTVVGRLPRAQVYSTSDVHSELGVFPDGAVFVGRQIENEIVTLPVILEDRNTTQKSLITVIVEKANDHAPTCQTTEIYVPESTVTGSVIGKLLATDLDSGADGVLSFKLVSSDDDVIYVEGSTGNIKNLVEFDAERTTNYTFTYEVSDYGSPRRKTNCTGVIHVKDVNDNAPKFGSSYYSAKISGNANATVAIVHADDEDVEEKNRRVQYRLLNLDTFFYIDKHTGKIETVQDLPKTCHRVNLTIEALNVDSDNFLSSISFVLVTVVNSTELHVQLNSEPVIRIYKNDMPGAKVGRIEMTSSDSVSWSIKDPRVFLDSAGNVILKKKTKSEKGIEVVVRSNSGVEKRFNYTVEMMNSERNENEQLVTEIVWDRMNASNQILDLSNDWKGWKVVRIINENAESNNETEQLFMKNKILYGSSNLTDSFVFLESSTESDAIPHSFKVIHVITSAQNESGVCSSSVHLITPPATVPIPANCSDVSLQNQKPLQLHDGNLLVPSQAELISHVDFISEKKPFMMTLIKDSPSEEVKFASNNVLMLLSSVHNIGASFGRVTADSAYRIRYYLVGTHQISIDADTGELFLKERFYRNLNDIQIIAVIPTGIAKAKLTIEVIEDRLHLPKANFVVFAPNSLKSEPPIGKISIGRDDVIVDVIDEHFYVRRSEIHAKKHFVPQSIFYDLQGIVKKGKLSAPINVTIFFGSFGEGQNEQRENELMFEVEENSPVGTVVGVVPNNHISKYRLVDQNCGLLIDQDGIIRTTTSFDREKTSLLKTKMIEPAANRIWDLLVFIGDANDNKPKIVNAPGRIIVSKETRNVYKLMWEDPDETATDVNFAIVDGDPFGYLEVLDSGDISLKSLPSESFNAIIRINDNRPPFAVNSDDVTIEFQVVPQLKKVTCEDERFWIFGAVPKKNAVIGRMRTTSSEEVTWRIIPNSLPLAEFVIDPMTGELLMNSNGLLSSGDVFNLNVQVISYDAERTGFCKARVTVADISSSESIKISDETMEFFVSETTDRGTVIGRIRLENESDDVVFRILNDFNFTISPFDGTVFTNSPLDYEDVKSYKIRVVAEKAGAPASHADVVIHVTDENDEAPRFITGDVVNLRVKEEETTVAYPLIIGSSIAEDVDEGQNGVVTYSILSGNTSLFAVNSTTGDILALAPLDRELSDLYELIVEAKDAGIPSLTATSRILIHVEDVNDNLPEFKQSTYFVRIPENLPSGSKIIRIQATDKDENAELQYSIGDVADMIPFRIDVATGWIIVSGRVDREEKKEYEIAVVVKDGGKSTKCLVTVMVEDVNDNAPIVENQNLDVFVPVDVAEGDLLYVIDVHDPDRNDHLKFILNGTDADMFTVTEHGEILARKRSLTTKSFFSVEVTVVDDVGHSSSSEFTFYLHPSKEFPVWKEKMESASVREHENQEVAVFKAKGQGVRYSIVSRCKEHLSIESISGILSTKETLDREELPECPVFVIATSYLDNKPLSVITKMLIKVIDINDNDPIFDQQLYSFNVTENSGPYLVGRIHARDADSGENSRIYYEIVGGDKNHEFMITEDGEIETVRDLDRETESEYRLIIEAIDDGKPRRRGNTTVIVKVLDEDDNAPRFSRIFHVEIPEDAAIGLFVIQLSASDADETANHRFALESGEENAPFRVEEESGNVFVNDTLDFEKKSSYRIKVRLTDGVWLIETSLFITLRDVNDNFPSFEKEEYFMISEQDNQTLGQVKAVDKDSGENGKVRYSITSPFFRIHPNSGVITRLRPLPNALTVLEVTAADHGVPRLQRTCTVHVVDRKQFKTVRDEKLRGTAKREDVIGVGFSSFAEVFPRGSATVSSYGRLILNANTACDLWILENSTITSYSVLSDSIPFSESLKNETIHINLNATSPIGKTLCKLEVPGCSHFEPLPTSTSFAIDRNGKLKMTGIDGNESVSLEIVCNDGVWPKRNQAREIVIKVSRSDQVFVSAGRTLKIRKNRTVLPRNIELNVSSGTQPGSILWENKQMIPLSTETSSTFNWKHGDLFLKSSLDSEKTTFDVFGSGFRRSTITITPQEDSPPCPIFPQDLYFFETSGNVSEIHSFGWNSEALKSCRIRFLNVNELQDPVFHVNGSQLMSLKPLPSGTYQFSLAVESLPDEQVRSKCHVTVTVPVIPSADLLRSLPSVIFSRGNYTTSPLNPLLRLPLSYTLAEDSSFSITDSGAVWSRSTLKSTSRSVYRIPVIEKGQKKQEVIRVLLDEIPMDSENEKSLEYRITDNKKAILNIDVSNNNVSKCLPRTAESYEVTESCHVITPSSFSNIQMPVTSSESNATWNVNIINETSEAAKLQRSAVELELFGKKSAISRLIKDLRDNYNDMKVNCLSAWQSSEDLKYRVTFAMIDRNDVVIGASETKRTLSSFLEKHRPSYIDFVGFRSDQCERVICAHKNTTCQTMLDGSARRLISRSGVVVFDLPMKTLTGRCECIEGADCEEKNMKEVIQKKQMDDVIPEHKTCDEMDCGSDGECVMDGFQPMCRCREGKYGFESMYECGSSSEVFSMPSGHLDIALKNSSFLECADGCKGVQQIELDFRTVQGMSELFRIDFGKQMAFIEVRSGSISFSLSDEFTRPIQTLIEKKVNDGRWHRLLFQMSDGGKKVAIQVDGRGKEVKSRLALPMMFTARKIQLTTAKGFCFRRFLAQNQFVHPIFSHNKLFDVSSFPPSFVSSTCPFDPRISHSIGFFSNFSDTTTLVLLSVLAFISLIALSVCLLAIRRRWRLKSSSSGETERSGWKKATEIDAFAVHRPHRGHVNRSMVKSPDDDTYDVASVYGTQMKTTPTDDIRHVYTTSASRRYQPPSAYRRDGHINMAYL
ncbi:unnamed protein product [Caenorhabditis sp. 36 PRJEB53466]|nr:unnamed protein product [Caenorhabditis sp. 36 PRJEB53466]